MQTLSRNKTLLILAGMAALSALALPRPVAAQAAYTVTDLGTLGGPTSSARGINDAGIIVGEADYTGGHSHAFKWQAGVMTDLTTFGDLTSIACGINSAGDIVGWTSAQSNVFWGGTAFVLPHTGSNAFFVGKGANTGANGIDDYGQVCGNTGYSMLQDNYAFTWYKGTLTYLPTLGSYCKADDIVDNVVAGKATLSNGDEHPVYWDEFGIHDLGTFGGQSGEATRIFDSAGREVVGYAQTTSGDNHAFWADPYGMSDLGTLGGNSSFAYGIVWGDSVNIVGSAALSDGTYSAFLYQFFSGAMYDLNAFIPPGSGWRLQNAWDGNGYGQIVGDGTIGGATHAFLLTPNVKVASITVSPKTVAGDLDATGRVTLNMPAPYDTPVAIVGSAGIAYPSSCVVPAGLTSQEFIINTAAVTSSKTFTITAILFASSVSTTMTVRPIGVHSVTLTPSTVTGGGSATGKVTLESPAAPGPITVTFSSSNTAVAPTPASITIPYGSPSGSFTVNTNAVTTTTTVTIKATANGVSRSVKLTVNP